MTATKKKAPAGQGEGYDQNPYQEEPIAMESIMTRTADLWEVATSGDPIPMAVYLSTEAATEPHVLYIETWHGRGLNDATIRARPIAAWSHLPEVDRRDRRTRGFEWAAEDGEFSFISLGVFVVTERTTGHCTFREQHS